MKFTRKRYAWSLYVVNRAIYCPTACLTDSEYIYTKDPIDSAKLDDLDASAEAIRCMIERGNPRIPNIDWSITKSVSVVQVHLGIRSERSFVRKASLWNIERNRREWLLGQATRASGGLWWELPDSDEMESFPIAMPLETVARTIAARLAETHQ